MTESITPLDRPEIEPELVPAALEALLIMATEPVSEAELAASLGIDEPQVALSLAELAGFYRTTKRGFELRQLGGGWRYYTHPDLSDVLSQAVLSGQSGRLTQAGLETLAVISYLQPISRSRISAVRGVNVDGVVRTLLTRGLIAESGKDESTGAGLLTTTGYFLERMGLASLDELPPLAPNLPDAAQLDAELANIVAASLGSEAPERVPDDQLPLPIRKPGSPYPDLEAAAEEPWPDPVEPSRDEQPSADEQRGLTEQSEVVPDSPGEASDV